MLCMGARAEDFTQVINGLKYIIHTDESYAELTSNNYTQSEIVIPAKIAWEGKKYPVTELGNYCFSSCDGLTSVTIPSSVTSLGEGCFGGCWSLTSIYVKSATPLILNSTPFDDSQLNGKCTLYVPIGAAEAYENAPYWQAFSIIKEIDFTTAVNGVYTPGKLVTVYALDGTVVKRQADRTRLSETLPRGIYIVEGKKYVVR